jgi:hypothetical protein
MAELPEDPQAGPAEPTSARQAAEGALAAADLAIGIGASIGGGAVGFAQSVFRLGRPLLDSVMSPLTSAARTATAPLAGRTGQAWREPWPGQWLGPRLDQAATRGRQDREALTSAVSRLILARVPGVAAALLNQLDLTAVVTERVDVNAVAERVDVDAIARRVDLTAILDRLDPDAMTRYLVEELDLPAIIQSSTGSIMSDTVHDVRMQSISADERLNRLVDAMLLRRQPRRSAATGTAGPSAAGPSAAGPSAAGAAGPGPYA